MNVLTGIVLVFITWGIISIPAYLVVALMSMGGNKVSKFLLFLSAPVLIWGYGSEYIRETFNRKTKR